jgi:hypothetical protein
MYSCYIEGRKTNRAVRKVQLEVRGKGMDKIRLQQRNCGLYQNIPFATAITSQNWYIFRDDNEHILPELFYRIIFMALVYPPPLVRGEDTLAGWRRGWGGQYFGRRRNSSVIYIRKYFVMALLSL